MMVYKYSLHDPDSGKVLYEGTAADLAAQGVVASEKVLPTLWRDQQRRTRRHRDRQWDVTREKVEVACSRKAYKVRLKPKKTENAAEITAYMAHWAASGLQSRKLLRCRCRNRRHPERPGCG